MDEEHGFPSAVLAAPEDAALRLVYADWLEERGDPRAEYLQIEVKVYRLWREGGAADELEQRLLNLATALDPAWVAFMTTLGCPFRTGPKDRSFFDCEPAHLPFTETIGLRGRLMTFESNFRSARSWEPNLGTDIQLLCQLELGECADGAGCIPMHPFICEMEPKSGQLTGRDVLKALKARAFRSRHIADLGATRIPYPGYNPSDAGGPDNDEVHNDFNSQYIFPHNDEDIEEEINELSGDHGAIKRAVVDGQLWYVLLHTTPHDRYGSLFSDYVVLFAVGRSLNGDRLIGAVTHQVCHNLCD